MLKVIVAVSGASGAIYAQLLVRKLRALMLSGQVAETALIASRSGRQVFAYELGQEALEALYAPPALSYDNDDLFAPCASGTAKYDAMFVVPCSMGSMARIANGIADTLTARAADVMLKERRKLILVPREAPYNLLHLQNMQRITEAGGIICAASPPFYHRPATIEEAVGLLIDKMLYLAGIDVSGFEWGKAVAGEQ